MTDKHGLMNGVATGSTLMAAMKRPERRHVKCSEEHCLSTATHVFKLQIPPTGAFRLADTIEANVNAPFCLMHVTALRVADWLSPKMREGAIGAAKAASRPPPDFRRAKLIPIPLDSDEYEKKSGGFDEVRRRRGNRYKGIIR